MIALAAAALVVSAPMPVVHGAAGLERLLRDAGETPVVLHFWATWCPECVRELPGLAKALARARARGAKVVLLSLDDPKDARKAAAMLERDGVPGERRLLDAPDPAPVARLVDPGWDGALPATYVFRRGVRTARFVGPSATPGALAKALGG